MTITGLNLLAAALVGYLAVAGISPPLATILVGGGLVLVALIIFLSARATLKIHRVSCPLARRETYAAMPLQ